MKPLNIILLLIMFVGLVFEMVPKGLPLISPFLLVDTETYKRSHIYDIIEHVKFILLSALWITKPIVNLPIKVFTILSAIDLVEYIISNNEFIYYMGSFTIFGCEIMLPFSYNLIQLVVLCIFVVRDEIISHE